MLDIVILAAGMGTRMRSQLPKVLHPVAGRPMIEEVMATAQALEPNRCVIVVGHGADRVRSVVGDRATFALQAEQLGTGHAVMQAQAALADSGADTVLVLYGDTPLILTDTLRRTIASHQHHRAAVTLLTFLPADPTGYGRIVRDEGNSVRAIVEQRDATEAQRAIRESNSGIMVFDGPWLWENLSRLTLSPQGEYYLTDMPALAVSQGRPVEGLIVDEGEVMGINTLVQLAEASQLLWKRRRERWMLAGVTIVDPATLWLDAEVTIGPDTTIHPNVVLRGRTTIGSSCQIGPHALLDHATVRDGEVVEPFTLLQGQPAAPLQRS